MIRRIYNQEEFNTGAENRSDQGCHQKFVGPSYTALGLTRIPQTPPSPLRSANQLTMSCYYTAGVFNKILRQSLAEIFFTRFCFKFRCSCQRSPLHMRCPHQSIHLHHGSRVQHPSTQPFPSTPTIYSNPPPPFETLQHFPLPPLLICHTTFTQGSHQQFWRPSHSIGSGPGPWNILQAVPPRPLILHNNPNPKQVFMMG